MRWFLFFLAMSGCAESVVSLRVDPRFTAEERAAIARSAARWNAVTIPGKKITVSSGGAWELRREAVDVDGDNGSTCNADDRVIRLRPEDEYYWPGTKQVYWNPAARMLAFEEAATHEMGHALGLAHVDGGVMQARGERGFDLAPVDVAECRRVGSC